MICSRRRSAPCCGGCRRSPEDGPWRRQKPFLPSTLHPDAVLDLLTSLVEKSLVLSEEGEGEARYGLLETVRQYARDRLREAGETEAVRRRHLSFFLELAEEAELHLTGPEQGAWFE